MGNIKKNLPRILIAAFVFLIISQMMHIGGLTVSMDYYTHPNYYEVWSPLLISFGNVNTGISFFYLSIVFGFIGAIIFVSIFTLIGSSLRGSAVKRGLTFGIIVFLVANIPGTLSMFLLLSIPFEIVILWTLESFLSYVIGGAIVGRIMMPSPQKVKIKKRRIDFGGNPTQPDKTGDSSSDEPGWMKQHDASALK